MRHLNLTTDNLPPLVRFDSLTSRPRDGGGDMDSLMPSDWIKIRTDLYRDPKVIFIADALMAHDGDLARYISQNMQRDMTVTRNVMRNVTVGALVSVWGVTRHKGQRDGDDLKISGATASVVDDISDVPGFGEAMIAAGWLVEDEKGIIFPRFFSQHNVDPNDIHKAQARERQRKHRAKTSNVTVTNSNVTVTPRVEKSREGKKRAAPSPAKPRKRDPIWDAVEAEWFPSGVSATDRTRVGKLVRDLKDKGATLDGIRKHRVAYREQWPNAADTPEAVVKHWDQFINQPAQARPGRSEAGSGKYD